MAETNDPAPVSEAEMAEWAALPLVPGDKYGRLTAALLAAREEAGRYQRLAAEADKSKGGLTVLVSLASAPNDKLELVVTGPKAEVEGKLAVGIGKVLLGIYKASAVVYAVKLEDEVTALRARLAAAEGLLRPMAEYIAAVDKVNDTADCRPWCDSHSVTVYGSVEGKRITAGDCRAARAFLEGK